MNRNSPRNFDAAAIMEAALNDTDQFTVQYRNERKRHSKVGCLLQMEPALELWRNDKNFSFAEIAALLAAHKFPVSPQTIKAAWDRLQEQKDLRNREQNRIAREAADRPFNADPE